MKPLFLISCCKTKAPIAAAARDLYISPWFRKARAVAERQAGDWRILSAEHGLIDPGQVLDPYETTLTGMSPADRLDWALRVWRELAELVEGGRPVVILAGAPYRQHLETWLVDRQAACSVPLRGLGLGQQLRWLSLALATTREGGR